MNTNIIEQYSLSRYRATAVLGGEGVTDRSALFSFFLTACESVFGLADGSTFLDRKTMKWKTNSSSWIDVRLDSVDGETKLRVDARMFKFWHFTVLIVVYVISWNLFGLVMHLFGVGLIDPTGTPDLFVLFSALRFGSIGACVLTVHLVLRSGRKKAFHAAIVRLVSALEKFWEAQASREDSEIPHNEIVELIPETENSLGLMGLRFSTVTKWSIDPEMDESEKKELQSTFLAAGFDEHLVDYRTDYQTVKPVGHILHAGEKIRISLTPQIDGTKIDFSSDLSGFVPLLTILTAVIVTAVTGALLAYGPVIHYTGPISGTGGILQGTFWISLFAGSLVWYLIKTSVLSRRKKKIEKSAARLVELLDGKTTEY